MLIKPIQTKYKGYTFRSRLEARWAVFFDGLGINWNYEEEGFLIDGLPYLPDFNLPSFQGGCFVEVKPCEFTESELLKANNLVISSNKPLWKAVGVPDFTHYEIIFPDGGSTYTLTGIPNLGVATDRMFIDAGVIDLMQLSDQYMKAIEDSRHFKFS